MSTIEKAAAKLALRRKPVPAEDGVAGTLDYAQDRREPSKPTIMQGKSQGFVNSQEHFCDIDLTGLSESGYLTPGEGRSQLAQEMRRIKRPLLLNIQKFSRNPTDQPSPNLIMLTSSLPGEGKTFIAINLAISLSAELDKRVLLVDADVSKGGITEQLGIQDKRGLSDLLYETNYLGEEAVLTSNIERLSILAAGGNTDQIDELFASELMGTITQTLAEQDPDRIIVFDAPPMLATTEAAVLAHHMGQVVVVVEANKTPQDAVAQSVSQLEGCASVSMILNKTSQRDASNYGYGYGYALGKRRPAEASNQPEIAAEPNPTH